jgi:mannosyltransferase OCH1-like enzyme
MSIPKIIHYIWLGTEKLPRVVKECIKTWKKIVPDYEIIFWNEDNMPKHPYVEMALKHKRYAFASDYIRCWALYKYGGIYLDTDMFLIKPFDQILNDSFFIGKEDDITISAGIIGSKKKHPFIYSCLKEYEIKANMSSYQEEPIPKLITRLYNQTKPNITVYERDVFYPFPYNDSFDTIANFKSYIKPETIAVHLWNASWVEEIQVQRKKYNSIYWYLYRNILKFRASLNIRPTK